MVSYNVNDIFPSRINKLDFQLLPHGLLSMRDDRVYIQNFVAQILNDLGKQSASMQGLKRPMTSADKLMMSNNNCIYLIKDENAEMGRGLVFGLLKIGKKKLYLYDKRNVLVTTSPICVLDFYVTREYQRKGCGKELFDFMLQDTGSKVNNLAIDGPSPKMINFLLKHYGLHLQRQANNFSVDESFFDGNVFANADDEQLGGGREHTATRPEIDPASRFIAGIENTGNRRSYRHYDLRQHTKLW